MNQNTTKVSNSLFTAKRTHERFQFPFSLKHKIVRDLKIVTVSNGILEIEAVGYFNPSESLLDMYDRYSIDLEFVRFNGVDILPVLEVTGGLWEIEDAAVRYYADKHEQQEEAA